jgi:hypothetical protein
MSEDNNVVSLEEYKPHIRVPTPDGETKIIPMDFIMDVLNGDKKFSELPDWELLIVPILHDAMISWEIIEEL